MNFDVLSILWRDFKYPKIRQNRLRKHLRSYMAATTGSVATVVFLETISGADVTESIVEEAVTGTTEAETVAESVDVEDFTGTVGSSGEDT